MGGSSNPIAKAVSDISKVAGNVSKEVGKGINNVTNRADQAIDDSFTQLGRITNDGVFLDPNREKAQSAKDKVKQNAAEQRTAIAQQKQNEADQVRQNVANQDATEGSNIILGGKSKKKKGSASVSKGMGLSTGSTGLQV
mgnify:CR=1 FL=1